MVWTAAAIALSAQTFKTLIYFSESSPVFSSLVEGRDGNLYGTSNNEARTASVRCLGGLHPG